ncbi:MAG: DUF5977 domain-containing protein, partial [Niabella sp.]
MKKQRLILLLITFVCNAVLFSQNAPFIPNNDAMSFLQGVNANNSNGKLNYSIPIYDIIVGDLVVPVKINYTSGDGVKVSDIASNVGLGWSLNTGGMINSASLDGSLLCYVTTPTSSVVVVDGTPVPATSGFSFQSYSTNTSFGDIKRTFDDYSLLQPMQNADTMATAITGIAVKDRSGNVYKYIGEKSIVRNDQWTTWPYYNQYNNTRQTTFTPYVNSWQLSDISTPDGNIVYHYDTIYSGVKRPVKYEAKAFLGQAGSYPVDDNTITYVSKYFYKQLRIKSIDFPSGKITFIYNTNGRLDYIGASDLQKIAVQNLKGDIIKVFKFNYKYLINTSLVDRDSISTSPYENNFEEHVVINAGGDIVNVNNKSRRLILTGILQQDALGNNENAGYRFRYKITQGLPSWGSESLIDYWGYFNGIGSKEISTPVNDSIYFLNNCFEANDIDGAQGLLDSVLLPTGGINSFLYTRAYGNYLDINDLNKLQHAIGGYFITNIKEFDPVGNVLQNRDYFYYNALSLSKPVSFKKVSLSTPLNTSSSTCNNTQNYAYLSVTPSFPMLGFISPSYAFDSVQQTDHSADNMLYTRTSVYKNFSKTDFTAFFNQTYNYNTTIKNYTYNTSVYNGVFTPAYGGIVGNVNDDIAAVFGNDATIGSLKELKVYKDGVNAIYTNRISDSINWNVIGIYYKDYVSNLSLCNDPTTSSVYYNIKSPVTVYKTGYEEDKITGRVSLKLTSYYQNTDVVYRIRDNVSNATPTLSRQTFTYNLSNASYLFKPVETVSSSLDMMTGKEMIRDGVFLDRDKTSGKVKNVLQLHLANPLVTGVDSFKFATSISADLDAPSDDPSATATLVPDNNYDTVVANKWDDSFVNLLETKITGQPNITYIYGYSNTVYGKLLVAKIIGNTGYQSAAALINQSLLDSAAYYNDASIRTELNKLRNGLPDTYVETYTYKPLVGMTSSTDARGQVTYFEYDNFSRLAIVKDYQGNVIKKNCYNAYGDTTDCGEVVMAPNTSPVWQTTGNLRCAKDNENANTGMQEKEVLDTNHLSLTYNQLFWINAGIDTMSCPIPFKYYNTEVSDTFYKNDCGASYYTGSSVVYTVPANTYASAISQAAADAKAQADLNNNGTAYANAHGSCIQIACPVTPLTNFTFLYNAEFGDNYVSYA